MIAPETSFRDFCWCTKRFRPYFIPYWIKTSATWSAQAKFELFVDCRNALIRAYEDAEWKWSVG
jgi:hypothetical protein